MKTNFKYIFYPISKFGDYSNIDSTVMFYQRVNSMLSESSVVLDIGCGRGAYLEDIPIRSGLRNLRNKCKKVIGIDVDPQASQNSAITEFFLIKPNEPWPIPDNCIDLAVSDYVLEHVENPRLFFYEAHRVLKKGGILCVRTTNLFGYVGLFSKIIPDKFHKAILSLFMPNRKDIDIFPTLHRCNTLNSIKKELSYFKFDYHVFGYEDEPGYFNTIKTLYFLGYLYQKFAPNFFRHLIIAFGIKQ